MTRRRLLGGAVAVVILGATAVGAVRIGRSTAAAATTSDPLVPTTRVTRGSLELSVHANGELRASKSAMLIAPSVGGTLRILRLLDAGTSVKAGEVIAEFDPTEQQYALEQARSELEEAEQQIVKKKADLDVQSARSVERHRPVRRAQAGSTTSRTRADLGQRMPEPARARTGQTRLEQITADSKRGSTPIGRRSSWSKRSARRPSSRRRVRSRISTISCSGRRSTDWWSSATIATPPAASSSRG